MMSIEQGLIGAAGVEFSTSSTQAAGKSITAIFDEGGLHRSWVLLISEEQLDVAQRGLVRI
jgi:hypothetical protein